MTRLFRAAVAVGLAAAIGCGPKAPGPAPSVAVTLDGKPVAAGILVQLVGADDAAVATGSTDDSGAAVVRGGDGAPPPAGTYKVVVVDAGDAEENPMEPQKKKAAKGRVPPVFGKAATTKASVTLTDALGPFPVDLKSR